MKTTRWNWSEAGEAYTTQVWTGGHAQGPLWLGLHGLTGCGADFQPWFHHVADGGQWEAPDLPGHGGWGCPMVSSSYTMDNCLAMLRTRLESDPRPAVLVGYSMGGRVALHFALRYSHLLKGLVLIGANPGIREERLRQERCAWEQELCDKLQQDGVEEFLRYWQSLPIIATQARIPEPIWTAMRERRNSCDANGLVLSIRCMGTGSMKPMWNELSRIECPVLYCAGEDDAKYRKIGESVVAGLRRGTLAVVPGAGHAAHLEAIAKSADLVKQWAEKL